MSSSTSPATALITGASSGIGEALAHELAGRGASVILVARSTDKLEQLAQQLRQQYSVQATVISADLSQSHAAKALAAEVARRGLTVDILVNNAGLGAFGEFWELEEAQIEQMLAVNITALTELSRAFLPAMVERKRGRVLNVASTAAFLPGPLMSVYYASKAYVLSLSEGLNEELRGSGVYVTALCPGPVHTGFQAVANLEGSQMMRNPLVTTGMLSAAEVARIGVAAMVRGDAVAVAGITNQAQTWLPRLLPRQWIARVIAQVQARR